MADTEEETTSTKEQRSSCTGCPSNQEEQSSQDNRGTESTETRAGPPTLKFTEIAADKIKGIMVQENIPGSRLRIMVRAGGCAGFSYDMAFDEKEKQVAGQPVEVALASDPHDATRDVLFTEFGVTIIVDNKTLSLINGTTIDFVETLQESGFKFNNPNAQSTCGCEKSFA